MSFGNCSTYSSCSLISLTEFYPMHVQLNIMTKMKKDHMWLVELFFWVTPSSSALCLANSSHFSLPKLQFLFPQLSKTTSSTWVNLPYSAVPNIPLGRNPGYQRPLFPIIQYLKTVIPCLLCTSLVLNGERISLVPVIPSGPKIINPKESF